MKSAIYMDGNRFVESEFQYEKELEKIVQENSKTLFGEKTIFFDIKSKVDSKSLGGAIPDGFLFDFRDEENPEFYLVELELEKHDFYKHIFPQITKFFAFFKNSKSRTSLVEGLFNYIKSNPALEREFKKYLGRREIYKALKDTIDNSQNILLIIDENKPELQEVFETYTDTWDKMVKVEILKQYKCDETTIFTMNPDFEKIEFIEAPTKEIEDKYTERYHLEGVDEKIASIYEDIKKGMENLDPAIKVNPQKYYISLRKKKNFAFIQVRKKKLHIVIMLPYETGDQIIKNHNLKQLSETIQKFWGSASFKVTLENKFNLNEIMQAIEEAYRQQNS